MTRTLYKYEGEGRTFSGVYKNYLDALKSEDFQIIGDGISVDRNGVSIGSRQWMEVTFGANPSSKPKPGS